MSSMITTLTSASTKNPSLRTTVPAAIVHQFSLRDGDKLDWKIEFEDNKTVIVIRTQNGNRR